MNKSNTGIGRRIWQAVDTQLGGICIQISLLGLYMFTQWRWPIILLLVLSVVSLYVTLKGPKRSNLGECIDADEAARAHEAYVEELTEYVHGSGIAHEKEATVEQVIGSLLTQRRVLMEAVAYHQTLDAMNQKVIADLLAQRASEGIRLRGWWCTKCDIFNGEERQTHTACRHCNQPKPAVNNQPQPGI